MKNQNQIKQHKNFKKWVGIALVTALLDHVQEALMVQRRD
jgi:hypothetical protein